MPRVNVTVTYVGLEIDPESPDPMEVASDVESNYQFFAEEVVVTEDKLSFRRTEDDRWRVLNLRRVVQVKLEGA